MYRAQKHIYLVILFIVYLALTASTMLGQTYDGYTLFSPNLSRNTYLVNMSNSVVHSWTHTKSGGYSCYLLEDGSVIRPATSTNSSLGGGGEAGIVQKYSWLGTLTWEYTYSGATIRTHHDIEPMPNGNVLLIAWEVKSASQSVTAGLDHSAELWPDHIIEVQPVGSTGGNIVWKWHAWDHLIQDYDSTKANYGVVADHPELLDINLASWSGDWMHLNGISYNAELDQIVLSSHELDEIYVIDHSTTTAEAAGHTGGNSGKGGDILYRWGKPANYDAPGSQEFNVVHCSVWIPDSSPGGGHIMAFNNRQNMEYSVVVELVPPSDSLGNYTLVPGSAYGPSSPVWSYTASGFYSFHLGGCQRLPNGNTLIVESGSGYIFEVNSSGTTQWSYTPGGEISRALRYGTDYPGVQFLNPAIFSVAPATLEFSNQPVSSSKNDSLTVKNTGTGALVISSLTLNNTIDFTVTETGTVSVPVGDSTRIHVTFHPASAGLREGRIIFVHNGTSSPDTAYVTGTGISEDVGQFSANPVSLSFSSVLVSTGKSDSVLITNSGTALLTISGIVLNNTTDFSVTETGPLSITEGDDTYIHVTFHPGSIGVKQGRITFTHDGDSSPDTVHVEGIGFEGNQIFLALNSGWNLVSLPLNVDDWRKSVLFANAQSDAFRYGQAYETADTLEAGVGYWVKYDAGEAVAIAGDSRLLDTIDVQEGWNMIGSLSEPVVAQTIESIPGGIVTSSFFDYTTDYNSVDTLRPGYGYWVKVSQAGELILVSGSIVSQVGESRVGRKKILPYGELPPSIPKK